MGIVLGHLIVIFDALGNDVRFQASAGTDGDSDDRGVMLVVRTES